MDSDLNEPAPSAPVSPWARPPAPSGAEGATRHDGWTGERMAIFCETLTETGLVVDACLAAGKSTNTAYSTRRRAPIFAAAWEAALTIARERLADTLLARSIEGTTEQYFKDGALVGEKRVIDNRLGLAILSRLDRMAETGSPLHSNAPRVLHPNAASVRPERSRGTALSSPKEIDWDLALSALRSGEPEAVAEALAMLDGGKAREAHDPPIQPPSHELRGPGQEGEEGEDAEDEGPIRIWCEDGVWFTDFAPPPAYNDFEKGRWGDYGYKRICTEEEARLLDADRLAQSAGDRAEDEAEREAWFADLKADLEARDETLEDGPGGLAEATGGD